MTDSSINTLPQSIPRKGKKKVPVDVHLYLVEDTHPVVLSLLDDKDWAIIFEDVLEVKTPEGAFYWPLDQVRSWKVVEHGSERQEA